MKPSETQKWAAMHNRTLFLITGMLGNLRAIYNSPTLTDYNRKAIIRLEQQTRSVEQLLRLERREADGSTFELPQESRK